MATGTGFSDHGGIHLKAGLDLGDLFQVSDSTDVRKDLTDVLCVIFTPLSPEV